MAQEDSTERWLPVPGYEGRYEVSSLGRIQQVGRGWAHVAYRPMPGRLRKLVGPDFRSPYLRIDLMREGAKRRRYVHDIVTSAFLGPKPPKFNVDHVDGDKTNNRISNLEYVTPRVNRQRAWQTGLYRALRGEETANHKLTVKDVQAIRLLRSHGFSYGYLARLYRVDSRTVRNIVARLKWAHVP